MKEIANNKNLAGQRATKKEFFGGYRIAVYAVHTRFDAIQWFVADAWVTNEEGYAEVVGQYDTREQAIARKDELMEGEEG